MKTDESVGDETQNEEPWKKRDGKEYCHKSLLLILK